MIIKIIHSPLHLLIWTWVQQRGFRGAAVLSIFIYSQCLFRITVLWYTSINHNHKLNITTFLIWRMHNNLGMSLLSVLLIKMKVPYGCSHLSRHLIYDAMKPWELASRDASIQLFQLIQMPGLCASDDTWYRYNAIVELIINCIHSTLYLPSTMWKRLKEPNFPN